jgi:MerR family copper efflux transcriptional regulator
MEGLTIHEAAEATGWSPRMLRYIERVGLLDLARSSSGYRLYGAEQLQRLRTLRELISEMNFGLAELGFALRLRREPALRVAVDAWFDAEPARPEHVPADDWLRWEQDKHQALITAASHTTHMEIA